MLGYCRDSQATTAAQLGNWLRTGDLAMQCAEGSVAIRDKTTDLIFPGEEDIASIEMEHVIEKHQNVRECAVVGMPDQCCGKISVAFVTTREGTEISMGHITARVRARLASFKVTTRVECTELPQTSTGEIHNQGLPERASGGDA